MQWLQVTSQCLFTNHRVQAFGPEQPLPLPSSPTLAGPQPHLCPQPSSLPPTPQSLANLEGPRGGRAARRWGWPARQLGALAAVDAAVLAGRGGARHRGSSASMAMVAVAGVGRGGEEGGHREHGGVSSELRKYGRSHGSPARPYHAVLGQWAAVRARARRSQIWSRGCPRTPSNSKNSEGLGNFGPMGPHGRRRGTPYGPRSPLRHLLPAEASHALGADSRLLLQFRVTPRALACLASSESKPLPRCTAVDAGRSCRATRPCCRLPSWRRRPLRTEPPSV